jgi:hypothetical protein
VEEQASGAQEGSVPGTGGKTEAPGLTSSQIFTRVQWLGNDVAMLIGLADKVLFSVAFIFAAVLHEVRDEE